MSKRVRRCQRCTRRIEEPFKRLCPVCKRLTKLARWKLDWTAQVARLRARISVKQALGEPLTDQEAKCLRENGGAGRKRKGEIIVEQEDPE